MEERGRCIGFGLGGPSSARWRYTANLIATMCASGLTFPGGWGRFHVKPEENRLRGLLSFIIFLVRMMSVRMWFAARE